MNRTLRSAFSVVLFIVTIVLVVLAILGCDGGLVQYGQPDLGAQHEMNTNDMDVPEELVGPAGNLPIGYYQRQCQWDACGGPLPNQGAPSTNPQPLSH